MSSKSTLRKAKEWDNRIKMIISSNKNWRIPPPTVTEHYDRIYGKQKTTIWLSWEDKTFELGVYFVHDDAIEFSIQENAIGKKRFHTETYTPLSDNHSARTSKSIKRNIEYIYLTYEMLNYPKDEN